MGKSKTNERKLAAFFHELGHILNEFGKRDVPIFDENCNLSEFYNIGIYEHEKQAWLTGFREAAAHHIIFNGDTINYCLNYCLKSYYPKNEGLS